MSEFGVASEPLEALCVSFERHTDRRPDYDALVGDMSVALDTVTERPAGVQVDRNELIDKLVGHFDTQQSNPIRTHTLEAISRIGELAVDVDANRQQRWGAIAFLGLLAMSFRVESAVDADKVNPQEARQQLISLAARDSLMRIVLRTDTSRDFDTQQANLAAELLKHSGMHPEQVGVDLMGLELPTKDAVLQVKVTEVHRLKDSQEKIPMGAFIDAPVLANLDLSDSDITEKLSKMDWIKERFDFENPLNSYPVYHDGQLIAILYDLTVGNTKFENIFEELKNNHHAPNFWSNLAATIVSIVQHHMGDTVTRAKVTPIYVAKRQGANEHVTRAYFTPLGSSEDGTRRFGLIAAHRTKKSQQQILRVISTLRQARVE